MGYLHIDNLYKNTDILAFREVYALEKIHGSSAHIRWDGRTVSFKANAVKHERFVSLFDIHQLGEGFDRIGQPLVIIYGEVYGGKLQGMRETYGDDLRFIAFDVKIGDCWLSVPQADALVGQMGLEFVHYSLVPTDMERLNYARDSDSVQAFRNGMGLGKKAEGVVLRPPYEVRKNNGKRVIAKHRNPDFRETKTKRVVGVKPVVLTEAHAVAEEWVTEMRLTHVLGSLDAPATGMGDMPCVLQAMLADIQREGAGEFVDSKQVRRAISQATAEMFKVRLALGLGDEDEDE